MKTTEELKNLLYKNETVADAAPDAIAAAQDFCEGYKTFLNGEVRYNSLVRSNPEKAEALFDKSEQLAKEKYDYLQKLVALYGGNQ